jgi:N-methylhydantoinase B
MFIRGMSDTVRPKLDHYGAGTQARRHPLTNDAYITGSHLYHMTFTVPIFHDGEVVAFSCCMAHWPDVGGTLDGATTDIYSEGLQMPIVKMYRKGVLNEELVAIIRSNVRLPERAMGDFRAQIAAVKTGERRFLEMIQKYGRDAVLGGIETIMDHSEARTRARVREIPDGVYEAESFMDDDGVKIGERIPIKVRVEINGDRMKVDLTNVSKQVAGFYNSGETAGRSCRQVAFAPDLGSTRRSTTVSSACSRLSCRPGAWSARFAGCDAAVDDLSDDHHRHHLRAGAGDPRHHRGPPRRSGGRRINGRRPTTTATSIWRTDRRRGVATQRRPQSTIAMNDGDTHNGPSEQVGRIPAAGRRYARGPIQRAGRFRGGRLRAGGRRATTSANSQMDRVKCKPWGLDGGRPGNGVAIHRFGKTRAALARQGAQLRRTPATLCPALGRRRLRLAERDLKASRATPLRLRQQEAAEKYYGAVFSRHQQARRRGDAGAAGRDARARPPHDEPIADTGVPLPALAHVHPRSRARSSARRAGGAGDERAVLFFKRPRPA